MTEDKPTKLTEKQQIALECVLEAGGSYSGAVALCAERGVKESYLKDLMYRKNRFKVWRAELHRCLSIATERAIDVAALTKEFVIRGLIGLATGVNVQDGVQLGAYKALGDHLGIWAAKEAILTVRDLEKVKEMGLEEEVMAELVVICKELGIEV